MINVTKPYLPNIERYKKYIDRIYDTNWLTNDGPLVRELEDRLKEYLEVKNIVLVSNGTLALQIAYRLLDLKGEVITTPFSFVATASSLTWEHIDPVFADINSTTFNIDTQNVEEKITENTSAIVPVHVFGNSCDVESLEALAKKNNLKIVYDAAHAFGVKYKNKSVLEFGDVSTLSFHATKLFHTIEGGALVFNDDDLYAKAKRMINFGYDNWEIRALGINAKMNEFQAAMGLSHLDDMDEILGKRKALYRGYTDGLKDYVGFQELNPDCSYNYSYMPILLDSEQQTLDVVSMLNGKNIYPRRYFHPSLDTVQYITSDQVMNVSRDISSRILCLPIYPDLPSDDQAIIVDTIIKAMGQGGR